VSLLFVLCVRLVVHVGSAVGVMLLLFIGLRMLDFRLDLRAYDLLAFLSLAVHLDLIALLLVGSSGSSDS